MKKIYIYLFLIIVLLFYIAIICTLSISKENKDDKFKEYDVSPLTVVIDWEIEKSFDFQVFYLKDTEWFSEKDSIHQKVNPSDKHIEIILPVNQIHGLRIDFGSNPGKIIIKNIEVKADRYENFNLWENWSFKNIDDTEIFSDGSLVIESDEKDPYMFYQPQINLSENTEENVLRKKQGEIQEKDLPAEPTTAKIIISGKAYRGVLPFEVYLNGSDEPLLPIQSTQDPKEQFIIIEEYGMGVSFDIKTSDYSAKYAISLEKPENDEKYIKYTSLVDRNLRIIHPKLPEYVSIKTPFRTEGHVKKEWIDHYEIKWQKVHEIEEEKNDETNL